MKDEMDEDNKGLKAVTCLIVAITIGLLLSIILLLFILPVSAMNIKSGKPDSMLYGFPDIICACNEI